MNQPLIIFDRNGILVESEPIVFDFQSKLLAAFRTDLTPVEGIRAALSSIDLAKCFASSPNMARIRISLSLTRLENFFGEHTFSTDLVARGKPHPDVFLHAAHVMGAAPEEAVVIEDSPAGIRAAKAAGMRVIGFYGARHAAPAKLKDRLAFLEPDLLVDDMVKLPHAIETLMAKTH